jgi:hypothetical protein
MRNTQKKGENWRKRESGKIGKIKEKLTKTIKKTIKGIEGVYIYHQFQNISPVKS